MFTCSAHYTGTTNAIQAVTTARALYDYTAQNPDELSLTEGDTLTVIEQSDPDWWKIEHQGHVRVVPALYLEAVQGRILHQLPRLDTEVIPDGAQNGSSSREVILRSPDAQNADSPSNVGRFSTSAALSPVVAGRPTRSALSSPSTSVSYLSSEAESDDESDDSAEEGQTDEQVRAERQTRELERKRVLEAAGLIVKPAPEAPPRPAKRRRAPAPPPRTSSSIPTTVPEDGLLEPEDDADDIPPPLPPKSPVTFQLDDAYERYQKYQLAQPGHNKRMSVSSVDVPPSPSGTTNSSLMLPSSGGESRYSSLFALFGRSKTPAGDDIAQAQKSRPVISGPISGPVTHLPSRENSPAFGSSWASLVDKSALEDMPKVERRRQEAIFELIATETAYVRDLQLIVENFCGSLMSMLDEKAVQVIFANIEDILITNTTFLSMLEERQKQSRLYIVSVGDIVEQQIALMGVYLKYCVNHSNAIKTLQALRASKLDLAVHLQQLRDLPDLRNLDLSSFLLIPMQRITRYPLLIKQIIAYTEPGNERLMLESSLRNAEEILESINESIREQENDQRLEALSKNLWIGQGRLDLTAPTRYMGSRKLLKEGELWKAKSRRKLLVILCNDIVVFIDETAKSLYRMPLPLSELRIGEVPGRRDDCAFQLFPVRPKAASETIALRASSARECQSWMKAMEGAILRAMRADNRATRLSVSSI
ncbi:Dbl homology domain-containing protein [Auriculariales sp. MPI-PUGE-AT-0066]|nr:Dbl homology domain-containing protein [Auriculariales sp. MPI-PUGE-AT-0066]